MQLNTIFIAFYNKLYLRIIPVVLDFIDRQYPILYGEFSEISSSPLQQLDPVMTKTLTKKVMETIATNDRQVCFIPDTNESRLDDHEVTFWDWE